jgi:photosystem II stability/assembly factor-like uncharacterized protein
MMKTILTCILSACILTGYSQRVELLQEGTKSSLRGLSVVSDDVIWCSGSNGMVGKSVDGGLSFRWIQVKGYQKRDFRDIEAFDSSTSIIMAVAEPAIILKTSDGGFTWRKVFEDTTTGMFLDAMDFDGKNGVVVGDPIRDKFFLAETSDFGDTWQVVKKNTNCTSMLQGEAFFASSGSNIIMKKLKHTNNKFVYVSGGILSRLFIGDVCLPLPLQSGKNSTGANAIDISPSGKTGIVVGGDFSNDKYKDSSCVLVSFEHGTQFSFPTTPLHGYKSSVSFVSENEVVSCGTSGVDFSNDQGLTWQNISNLSFHVVKKSKIGKSIFFAGGNGKLGRLRTQ